MTESEIPSFQGENQSPKRLKFKHIKSNFFRVIHVDGISGGVTPTSDLCINLYSERWSIPNKLVYELDAEGSLEREVVDERDDINSVIREIDVSAVMSIETAKKLVESLQFMIEAVEDEQEEEDNE
jgi:hypothetical protein